MIPQEGLDWVMTTVNTLWRVHKSRVKKQHYYAFDSDDERWKNRPETMSDQQFLDLLQYWNMEEIEVFVHLSFKEVFYFAFNYFHIFMLI